MQSYSHFTMVERESLYRLFKSGSSLRQIAKVLGRNVSSVSRELKRNQDVDGRYNTWNATFSYIKRRKRCKRRGRFDTSLELKSWVI